MPGDSRQAVQSLDLPSPSFTVSPPFRKPHSFPPPHDPRLPRRLAVRTSFFENERARGKSGRAPEADDGDRGESSERRREEENDDDANGRPSQFQRGERLNGPTDVDDFRFPSVYPVSPWLFRSCILPLVWPRGTSTTLYGYLLSGLAASFRWKWKGRYI